METVGIYFAVLTQYLMSTETNLLQRAMASTQIKKEEDRWEITQAVKLESHIKFCIAAEPNKYYMKDSIICAILMVNSVNNDDAYVA